MTPPKRRGRDVVRLLTPPILLAAARRLARRPPSPNDVPSVLQGPYGSWAEAVAQADGWEAPAILARTRALALQLKRGEIVFQQDAVVLARVVYSPAILALIAMLAARDGGRIDLIDIGGSLGTNFQQNRKLLAPALARGACRWRVVETPAMAALGRAEFEEPGLSYFDSWRDAVAAGGPPAGVLFSGAFQYIEDPDALLAEIAAAGAGVVGFDRTLLQPGKEDRYFVQHTEPDRYGGATAPVRVSGRDGLIARLAALGFELVETFPGPRARTLRQPGLLFARGA
jgi:putative methyltransferase (TIGR04325 family)